MLFIVKWMEIFCMRWTISNCVMDIAVIILIYLKCVCVRHWKIRKHGNIFMSNVPKIVTVEWTAPAATSHSKVYFERLFIHSNPPVGCARGNGTLVTSWIVKDYSSSQQQCGEIHSFVFNGQKSVIAFSASTFHLAILKWEFSYFLFFSPLPLVSILIIIISSSIWWKCEWCLMVNRVLLAFLDPQTFTPLYVANECIHLHT